MIFCDSHFHSALLSRFPCNTLDDSYMGICCSLTPEEFSRTALLIKNKPYFYSCYGVHPLYLSESSLLYLEELLKNNQINAVGECGYDFYSKKTNVKEQMYYFNKQLDLCIYYRKGMIIHNRKGFDELFCNVKELSNIPFVIFHGFSFTKDQALSLLKHNVNAYFSFGKTLLLNSKKNIDCLNNIPLNRILFETDAPFMAGKNREKTDYVEIKDVYKAAGIKMNMELSELCNAIYSNFKSLCGLF